MRQVRIATLGLLIVGAILPGSLSAQTIPSPFRFIEERHTFGLFAGYLSTNPGRLDMGPQPGPVIGGRYDLRLAGPLSGELAVGYSPTSRMVYVAPPAGSENPPTLVGERDVALVIGEAGLRFHLNGSRTWRGLAPYVTLTIGVVENMVALGGVDLDVPAEQRFDFGPGFAINPGLGSDVFLTERFSLRADIRDHLWRITYPDRFVTEGTSEVEWTHNFSLTLGGSFHF